jgi:hypothetical protein
MINVGYSHSNNTSQLIEYMVVSKGKGAISPTWIHDVFLTSHAASTCRVQNISASCHICDVL